MTAPAQDQAELLRQFQYTGSVERMLQETALDALDRLAEAERQFWDADEDAKVSRELLAVSDRNWKAAEDRLAEAERLAEERQAEIDRLKVDLDDQWQSNHAEHCGCGEPDSPKCNWHRPAALTPPQPGEPKC